MPTDEQTTPQVIYHGEVGDLLNGEDAFADGLIAAYREACRIRDSALGMDDHAILDNVLTALAKLSGEKPSTGPLDKYKGADRDLRDKIEHTITTYFIREAAGLYVPGTIHLANAIMRLVKGETQCGEGERNAG